MKLDKQQQRNLLSIAKQSIDQAWQLEPQSEFSRFAGKYLGDQSLKEDGASFVTLDKAGQLRGCIGSLEAVRPLAEDVFRNAFSAAFHDPRFSPLEAHETGQIKIEISTLSVPQAIEGCDNKQTLLQQLRPFEDGLILTDGFKRATFLPSVWEQLPEKNEFVDYLMRKGGMYAWSDSMRCERYTTFKFSADWEQIET
ncbi:AmmeMemoRadiSam system protein A [Thiomicrorhabdus sp.]|uniref:AmmeMemoRadiSam system protein A n=1 Tax=Thiomicrorhabdus sp. TaxID=2039724 RepID=UPI0029C7DA6A|nr:AmmeMemoRadiSam system protein A [Thiomicrorhabdus sp.]